MAIRKHLSTLAICLLTVFALGGLLPATALAAAPSGQAIYVGNVNVTSGGYWTTGNDGTVTAFTGEGTPADNFIHYDATNNVLTLHNAAIKESVPSDTSTYVEGAAIGVFNQNGAAELTIQLEDTNTIAEVSAGIYVLAFSNSTGDASLTITGDGSLDASGSYNPAIRVQSNSSNATLSIENAKVTATASSPGDGVLVQSKNNSSVSLTVDGGSLTASGSSGILYESSGNASVPNTVNLTISNSALVDARDGGISAGSITNLSEVSPTDSSVGIVFDGDEGTVYGDVTLQEDLTISESESLKLDSGATLNAGSHNVIVDGGTVDDGIKNSLGDSVKYAPSITTTNLPNGTVGTSYGQTLAATGSGTITWSIADGSSLPAGLRLNKSTAEYWTCKTCGKIFSDAAGKTEITLADTVIPVTNHNYKDGKCTVCGAVDPNYQEPTNPTKDEPATEDSTKNTKDNTVTKSSTPQTSDALFGYAVFFAAIIVLASIVSVVAYRKLHTVQAKHSSSNKH